MLWQRGPGQTNRRKERESKPVWASLNYRLKHSAIGTLLKTGLHWLSDGDTSSRLSTRARRAAAATLSGSF